jgi:hypothetical protein
MNKIFDSNSIRKIKHENIFVLVDNSRIANMDELIVAQYWLGHEQYGWQILRNQGRGQNDVTAKPIIAIIGGRYDDLPVIILPEPPDDLTLATKAFENFLKVEETGNEISLVVGFGYGYQAKKGQYTLEQVIAAYEQGTKDGRFHTSNETDDEYVRRNATEYAASLDIKLPLSLELELEEWFDNPDTIAYQKAGYKPNAWKLMTNEKNEIHPINVVYA